MIILTSSATASEGDGGCCPLTTSKASHPPPWSTSWGSSPASCVPVVRTVALSLAVGVGVYQGLEEELEEGNDAPEEVSDGVETPGLGLEHPPIRGNVHHLYKLQSVS